MGWRLIGEGHISPKIGPYWPILLTGGEFGWSCNWIKSLAGGPWDSDLGTKSAYYADKMRGQIWVSALL